MKQLRMTTYSSKDILFGSLICFDQLFSAWVDVILQKESSSNILRRNAIAIWLSGLMEFLGKSNQRREAIKIIEDEDISIPELIKTLSFLEEVSRNLLSLFSEDEQVMIWLIRNQSVHGHLSLYFHDDLGIPIYDSENNEIITIRKTRQDLDIALVAKF